MVILWISCGYHMASPASVPISTLFRPRSTRITTAGRVDVRKTRTTEPYAKIVRLKFGSHGCQIIRFWNHFGQFLAKNRLFAIRKTAILLKNGIFFPYFGKKNARTLALLQNIL